MGMPLPPKEGQPTQEPTSEEPHNREALDEETERDPEPAGYQFLRNQSKTRTPPWAAAIAVDPNYKTVKLVSEKSLKEDKTYKEVPISARENEVALFAQYGEDELRGTPTTQMTFEGEDGAIYSNILLVKFRLNKMPIGRMNHLFRFFGVQPSLYVRHLEPSRPSSLTYYVE